MTDLRGETPAPSSPAVPEEDGRTLGRDLRHEVVLAVHLARREIALTNRFSFVGAAWPLVRQLAQLGVLVFAFSAVLDLDIQDYPVFVFAGLIGWTWFTAAIATAATSITSDRALAMRAGFPTIIVPIVAVAVPFVDVLYAMPVLVLMLAGTGELHATLPLLIPLLALQAAMMIGIGWLVASLSVYLRDVPQLVAVVLLMGFYLTPVYFDVAKVPDDYQWILRLNPMAVLLEADRAVLLGTPFPPVGSFVGTVVFAAVMLVVGRGVFHRLSPGFVDEL